MTVCYEWLFMYTKVQKKQWSMPEKTDIRFFPVFLRETADVLLEVIATLVDEIVVGNLFDDAAFASIHLVELYMMFEVFVAYRVSVACALRDVVLSIGLGVLLGVAFGLIGLAIAPAAWAFLRMYLRARYGMEDSPLLLSKVPGNDKSWLFQLEVEPVQIIDLQRKVEAVLLENHMGKAHRGQRQAADRGAVHPHFQEK